VALYVFDHRPRGLDCFAQFVAAHAQFLGPILQLMVLIGVNAFVVLPAGLLRIVCHRASGM
jgi:hypothetical protein